MIKKSLTICLWQNSKVDLNFLRRNHEWGNIGTNYIRGLVALGLQGFLIMVITGIYAILVKSLCGSVRR